MFVIIESDVEQCSLSIIVMFKCVRSCTKVLSTNSIKSFRVVVIMYLIRVY